MLEHHICRKGMLGQRREAGRRLERLVTPALVRGRGEVGPRHERDVSRPLWDSEGRPTLQPPPPVLPSLAPVKSSPRRLLEALAELPERGVRCVEGPEQIYKNHTCIYIYIYIHIYIYTYNISLSIYIYIYI